MRPLRTLFFAALIAVAPLTGEVASRHATWKPDPASTPSADEPMAPHADPVASYTMTAKLDPYEHKLAGLGTIHWKNASAKPVTELWFHLYLNAFKNQSSVFLRAPIGGFRGSTLPADWGAIDLRKLTIVSGDDRHDALAALETKRPNDDDETDARLPLPSPVLPGGTIDIEMEWEDKLPSIVERTGYFETFHMLGQWFPKLARLEADGTWAHFPFHHLGEFYADFGDYDVTIDVPSEFIVGATGPAVSSEDHDGRHVERHVQSDIHDFAFTAWDKWVVRKERIGSVDVTVMTPPHYEDHAERELATMRFALPHYGARYGAYPYSVLTVMHPPAGAPEAGGMEYPTLITTGQPSWMPRGIYFVEGVTIHEFGHQYFYGLCASNEDAWPFLDEGLNSYAENDAMRALEGPGSGIDIFGLAVGDVEAQADRAIKYGHDEPIAEGAGTFATGAAYGALVYSRTAAVLETLARVYGVEKMQHAMGVYARRYRFKHPTPNDFVATMRAELSPAAADNLRIALFDKGWVDYAVTMTSSHASHGAAGLFDRDGKRETVTSAKVRRNDRYDGWALVVRRGTLTFPVDVKLVAENGSSTIVPWDGVGDSVRIPYSGSSPLRAVVVDPDEHVLLDENRENDFATALGYEKAGAPRTLDRATFWAASILGALGP